MRSDADLLADLSSLAPSDFAREAYDRILGRPPTPSERERMMAALLGGETPTRLLGALRYGDEGRARGVPVPGLRPRYIAQRLFVLPIVGPVLQWMNALARLPSSLKYFRALRELDAERNAHVHLDLMRLADETREMQRRLDDMNGRIDVAITNDEFLGLSARLDATADLLRSETAAIVTAVAELGARLKSILPPMLGDTLEVPGTPLVAVALARSGIEAGTPLDTLSPSTRYAMFETVFYESPAVAAKQRVYLPYLDRELGARFPFLDLGCGRGEFLRILASAGFHATGVDVNPSSFPALRADGFDVIETDLLAFLERDRGTYAGISLLQVAEHLTREQMERMLALVAERLAPGGIFIFETPNPLSPFALAVFHTDPTHVLPLPPEAARYAIEAAGLERTRTLYQARIPHDQFAGPDPRAYYGDYAILAWRSSP